MTCGAHCSDSIYKDGGSDATRRLRAGNACSNDGVYGFASVDALVCTLAIEVVRGEGVVSSDYCAFWVCAFSTHVYGGCVMFNDETECRFVFVHLHAGDGSIK